MKKKATNAVVVDDINTRDEIKYKLVMLYRCEEKNKKEKRTIKN